MIRFLKKLAPRSLYARFLLIIIIPTVLVQLVATYMFYERHWSNMSRYLSSSLSGEIALIVDGLKNVPREEYGQIFIAARDYMGLAIIFKDGAKLPETKTEEKYTLLEEGLKKYLSYPFAIKTKEDGPEGDLNIFIELPGGTLDITTTKKRLASPTTYIFIMWMTGTATILLLVAILFLKNQVRSIIRLTEAAEKFGKGQEMPDFKPQGAQEVRLAAIAFIEMKERIKRLLTRRTQMLAGVSHDLRTPLTRLKLQLELLKETEAVKDMKSDIMEMERMLEGYLDFARGEISEPNTEINLDKFFSDVLSGYKNARKKISRKIPKDIELNCKPFSMKRCMNNLIDNALKYAKNVKISAKETRNNVEIIVDDDGPGIPKDKREEVFQPFYRLDKSRNMETGGVGLGLAIVRDIINSHGGEIKLDDSPIGGLRIIVKLPK